jgi:hypothetical protein
MTTADTSNRRSKLNITKSLKDFDKINDSPRETVPIILFYKSQSYRHLSIFHQKKTQLQQQQQQEFLPTKQNIYLETNNKV